MKADHIKVGSTYSDQKQGLRRVLEIGAHLQECPRKEFRAATVCREKGIIAKMPDRLEADERYFDVNFSPLGLAVLAQTIRSQSV